MGTTGGASQWNFVPLPMVLFLDYLRQWRRLDINFTGLQAATFSIAISTKVDHFYFANNSLDCVHRKSPSSPEFRAFLQ
jgi:hypothetical protein